MNNKTLILVATNIATVFIALALFISLQDTKQTITDKNNKIQMLESQAIAKDSMMRFSDNMATKRIDFLKDSLVELEDILTRYDTVVADYCQIYNYQRSIFDTKMENITRDYKALVKEVSDNIDNIDNNLPID